jgi:hypothetical protein
MSKPLHFLPGAREFRIQLDGRGASVGSHLRYVSMAGRLSVGMTGMPWTPIEQCVAAWKWKRGD